MSESRQRASDLIKQLQSYIDSTGDDYVEFTLEDTYELKVVKVHEAYEGENERYCEITLDSISAED